MNSYAKAVSNNQSEFNLSVLLSNFGHICIVSIHSWGEEGPSSLAPVYFSKYVFLQTLVFYLHDLCELCADLLQIFCQVTEGENGD